MVRDIGKDDRETIFALLSRGSGPAACKVTVRSTTLSAAYGGHNRNGGPLLHGCFKSAAVTHVFIVDENVEVLAYVALFGDYTVAQAGIFLPQHCEHFP